MLFDVILYNLVLFQIFDKYFRDPNCWIDLVIIKSTKVIIDNKHCKSEEWKIKVLILFFLNRLANLLGMKLLEL